MFSTTQALAEAEEAERAAEALRLATMAGKGLADLGGDLAAVGGELAHVGGGELEREAGGCEHEAEDAEVKAALESPRAVEEKEREMEEREEREETRQHSRQEFLRTFSPPAKDPEEDTASPKAGKPKKARTRKGAGGKNPSSPRESSEEAKVRLLAELDVTR